MSEKSNKDWFPKSKAIIEEAFGEDFDLFCRLLAATSPITEIRANVMLAIRAYQQLKWYNNSVHGFIQVHQSCIQRFISKEIDKEDFYSPARKKYPAGRKVWSLYQNMIGNYWVCAIDRWILYYFEYPKETRITSDLYDKLESRLFDIAQRQGVFPAEAQAQIWGDTRGSTESYGDIIRRKEINRHNVLARLF